MIQMMTRVSPFLIETSVPRSSVTQPEFWLFGFSANRTLEEQQGGPDALESQKVAQTIALQLLKCLLPHYLIEAIESALYSLCQSVHCFQDHQLY